MTFLSVARAIPSEPVIPIRSVTLRILCFPCASSELLPTLSYFSFDPAGAEHVQQCSPFGRAVPFICFLKHFEIRTLRDSNLPIHGHTFPSTDGSRLYSFYRCPQGSILP